MNTAWPTSLRNIRAIIGTGSGRHTGALSGICCPASLTFSRVGNQPRASDSAAAAIMAPENFGAMFVACQNARNHEQEIGKPVEILRHFGIHLLGRRERPDDSLRASHDAAREVAGGGCGAAA